MLPPRHLGLSGVEIEYRTRHECGMDDLQNSRHSKSAVQHDQPVGLGRGMRYFMVAFDGPMGTSNVV